MKTNSLSTSSGLLKRACWKRLLLGGGALLILCLFCGPAFSLEPPQKGDHIPELGLIAPNEPAQAEYLGTKAGDIFKLADLDCELVLLEIVGVYCPFCHEQAPLFNNLKKRISRAKLDSKVKMLAVASGATVEEISYLIKQSGYRYPVLRDQDYELHKKLGEPKTPYTILFNKKGEVLFAQAGIVKDIDRLFTTMRETVR